MEQSDRARQRTKLIVRNVVIAVCSVDAADKALLPATFKAMAEQLDFGPSQMGTLMFAQSITFSLALMLWGPLMRLYSVRDLMVVGCLMWAVLTVFLAFTTSYIAQFCLRLLIGVALASINPLAQALLCDVVDEDQRGFAFGLQQGISKGIEMSVSCTATAISSLLIFGMRGWRIAYLGVAGLSLILAVMVRVLVPGTCSRPQPSRSGASFFREQGKVLWKIVSRPSVLVMVGQGVTGGIPWNAFAFLTFYFQLVGYTDLQAGQIMLLGGLGGTVGAFIGGCLGDAAAARCRYAGRCIVAQSSIFLGTAFFVWMMNIPFGPSAFYIIVLANFMFNAIACWSPCSALRPICGELFVDSQERAQIFAVWMGLEGIISSLLGAPMVGFLSEWAGYRLGGHHSAAADAEQHANNVNAVRTSLLWVSLPPWALCALIWIPMYFTYPRDRARAQEEAKLGRDETSDEEDAHSESSPVNGSQTSSDSGAE